MSNLVQGTSRPQEPQEPAQQELEHRNTARECRAIGYRRTQALVVRFSRAAANSDNRRNPFQRTSAINNSVTCIDTSVGRAWAGLVGSPPLKESGSGAGHV